MRSIALSALAGCLMACASAAPLSACTFDHECAAGSCVAFAEGAFDRGTSERSMCTSTCVEDSGCEGLGERARCTGRGVCLALCADDGGCAQGERCAGAVCVPDEASATGGREHALPRAELPIGFLVDAARYALALDTQGALALPSDARGVTSSDPDIVSVTLGQSADVLDYVVRSAGEASLQIELTDGSELRVQLVTTRATTLTACVGCLGTLDLPVDERALAVSEPTWIEPVLRAADGSFLWAGDARFTLTDDESSALIMRALPSLSSLEHEAQGPGISVAPRGAGAATLEVRAAGLVRTVALAAR